MSAARRQPRKRSTPSEQEPVRAPIRARVPVWAIGVGLLIFGCAWANSLGGAFLLDDLVHVVGNPKIRSLWPPWDCFGDSARPIVDLSLAMNFAIGRLDPAGYHVVNLLIHFATGAAIYLLACRVLRARRREREADGHNAAVAFAIALLWLVHPLTTQGVTYVIQRGESLMSLFYVLTLYCFLRGEQDAKRGVWFTASVICCAAGFLCKGVMVTAPVAVLLLDWAIVSERWKEPFVRRWRLYVGLAATWGVLFALGLVQLLFRPETHGAGTVGFSVSSVTPKEYFLTQAGVLVHYLRLCAWPDTLVFDYLWPPVTDVRDALVPGIVVLSIVVAGLILMARRRLAGFVVVTFFLILAPTSSIVPISDLCVEHRMYLPLVCFVAIFVLALHAVARRIAPGSTTGFLVVVLIIAALLGLRTHLRNRDYASDEIMWRSVIAERPENYRAMDHLGTTLMESGRVKEAIATFKDALRIKPGMTVIENNLANCLAQSGELEEAISLYRKILVDDPALPRTHLNLALALQMAGRDGEAVTHYDAGMSDDVPEGGAWRNYALVLQKVGRLADAEAALRRALKLMPGDAEGYRLLGSVLERRGQPAAAVDAYRTALRIDPQNAAARARLDQLGGGNDQGPR